MDCSTGFYPNPLDNIPFFQIPFYCLLLFQVQPTPVSLYTGGWVDENFVSGLIHTKMTYSVRERNGHAEKIA